MARHGLDPDVPRGDPASGPSILLSNFPLIADAHRRGTLDGRPLSTLLQVRQRFCGAAPAQRRRSRVNSMNSQLP